MNGNTRLWLIIGAAVLLFAFYFFYSQHQSSNFNWSDSGWVSGGYSEESDQPYGTKILHRLLNDLYAGEKRTDIKRNLSEELPKTTGEKSTYFFIGEALYLDSADVKALTDFVYAGNTAFISSKTLPSELFNAVNTRSCYGRAWTDYLTFSADTVWLSVSPDVSAPCYYARQNIAANYVWHYIPDSVFCESAKALGYTNGDKINFAVFPHGKGRFFWHTCPIALANFSLLRAPVRNYAEGLLSWIPEGPIYWDASSRVPESLGRKRNGGALADSHPMAWILQQPGLATAWYILTALALLWVVFQGKRRRRIIPVLPANENNSYEFISTIAHLHFKERNYRGMCIQAMKLFLSRVRDRYGLTPPLPDPETGVPRPTSEYAQKLARSAQLPETLVGDIFQKYYSAIQFEPNENMLEDLHLAMERFFKQAQI